MIFSTKWSKEIDLITNHIVLVKSLGNKSRSHVPGNSCNHETRISCDVATKQPFGCLLNDLDPTGLIVQILHKQEQYFLPSFFQSGHNNFNRRQIELCMLKEIIELPGSNCSM